MRQFLSAIAIASLLGIAAPALADSGSGGSVQRAVTTARAFGVIGFNQIQFYDGKWEIEGRDTRGKTVRIDVDALTGAVLKLDRDY
ncbi:MAG: PepSY domain-containing protein [Xanthobacteraceae bacterium]|nr:PepSY domain-containing protein [Xanthobacteraceae bacterium]